jgi:hypothetical protein
MAGPDHTVPVAVPDDCATVEQLVTVELLAPAYEHVTWGAAKVADCCAYVQLVTFVAAPSA